MDYLKRIDFEQFELVENTNNEELSAQLFRIRNWTKEPSK